jgi:hypothetical protein
MVLKFGKYAGMLIKDVPASYLEFLAAKFTGPIALEAKLELISRKTIMFNFEDLTEEQQQVANLIKQGHNVILTGQAGSGKSFIIKQIANALVLCPTGISAINANGITYHRRFMINPYKPIQLHNIDVTEGLIVFDEAFYVSPVLLNRVLSDIPNIKNKQLIFTGDPYQLDPIKYKLPEEDAEEEEQDALTVEEISDMTLYDVLKLHEIKFTEFELLQSVRHKTDKPFAESLARMRKSKPLPNDLKLFNVRVVRKPDAEATILACRKNVVRKYNEDYIKLFESVIEIPATYKDSVTSDKQKEAWYSIMKKKLNRKPAPLKLALGAKVVILYNNAKEDYYNGDLATIEEISESQLIVKVLRTGHLKALNKNILIKGKTYLGFFNFGVALAKAMTIHKSQGCTLIGKVHVEIDPYLMPVWKGALYTAISRCQTLDQVTFNITLKKRYL